MSHKIKITNSDLSIIHDMALSNFKDKSSKMLSNTEFIARCYMDVIVTFLNKKGIEVELEYQQDCIYNSEPLD